mgnify:CR=1 FL=1
MSGHHQRRAAGGGGGGLTTLSTQYETTTVTSEQLSVSGQVASGDLILVYMSNSEGDAGGPSTPTGFTSVGNEGVVDEWGFRTSFKVSDGTEGNIAYQNGTAQGTAVVLRGDVPITGCSTYAETSAISSSQQDATITGATLPTLITGWTSNSGGNASGETFSPTEDDIYDTGATRHVHHAWYKFYNEDDTLDTTVSTDRSNSSGSEAIASAVLNLTY